MVKKIISQIPKADQPQAETTPESREQPPAIRAKKKCLFCQSKSSPAYSDVVTLKRFTTDRGRIIPKLRSGLCSKHQRRVTRQIKYARHLALLPFTPKV